MSFEKVSKFEKEYFSHIYWNLWDRDDIFGKYVQLEVGSLVHVFYKRWKAMKKEKDEEYRAQEKKKNCSRIVKFSVIDRSQCNYSVIKGLKEEGLSNYQSFSRLADKILFSQRMRL